MGMVVGTVRGTMRKFSSCGPEQAASTSAPAAAPAIIDKVFFAFIIFNPFRGLDNAANLFSMFHDALYQNSGMHAKGGIRKKAAVTTAEYCAPR